MHFVLLIRGNPIGWTVTNSYGMEQKTLYHGQACTLLKDYHFANDKQRVKFLFHSFFFA